MFSAFLKSSNNRLPSGEYPGWLGWAMVLSSFQCRGVLLLLHIVGQGLAVLAAGAGRVGYMFSSPEPQGSLVSL